MRARVLTTLRRLARFLSSPPMVRACCVSLDFAILANQSPNLRLLGWVARRRCLFLAGRRSGHAGEFTLMNYRLTGEFRTPFRVLPSLEELSPFKLELVLRLRADIPEANYGSNITVSVPMPRGARFVCMCLCVRTYVFSKFLGTRVLCRFRASCPWSLAQQWSECRGELGRSWAGG
jgi:hypothetical protein